MADFTLQAIIGVIAQTFCGGSMTLAGILVMMAALFVMIMILASVRAPITYALVPMMMLDIVFAALGIIDTTVSFIIIILCAVLVAKEAHRIVTERGPCLATTSSRSSW